MKQTHLLCLLLIAVGCTLSFHAFRMGHDFDIPGANPHDESQLPTRKPMSTVPEQPATPIGTTLAPKHHSVTSLCKPLPLNRSATMIDSIMLCYTEATCKGALQITVRDCELRSRSLSRNKTWDAAFKSLGPDLIKVRVEGPEVLSSYGVYNGNCRYSAELGPFTTKGDYNLAAELLYRNYDAQDEVQNQWPPLLKQPLLPVDPTFSSKYHFQQMTLPTTVNVFCAAPAPFVSPPNQCTGLEITTGRWVREIPSRPVHTRVRVKKIQKNPIIFQWAIATEPAARWRPEHCVVSAVDPQKITKRIVVGGDSQSRALYFGLVNYLNGNGDDCVRNITTIASEPAKCVANVKGSHRKQLGDAQVDFVDDLFLDKFHNSDRYGSYDVVVVGFAQHPASKEHWSIDKYRASLAARHRKAVDYKKRGKKVVWFLAPQYPHTRNGYPVVVKDWRTDRRIHLFNEEARKLMMASGIPVLDGFALSTGMSHSSPDQAHFSNFVSTEIVRMLMGMLV